MAQIYYYTSPSGENPFSKFLDSLLPKQQAKILRIFQYIRQYDLKVVSSHIKKLSGTPLWEIRILGKDNIRVVYISWQKLNILILHGFIKKTNKTPKKELKIALKRLDDWYKRFVN